MSNSLTFHKKPQNMKMRNKGKVYPSSSSSSTSTTTTPVTSPAAGDYLSVLNLLPAAILSLAVVLSLEDRQVLAYMITRSIKSSSTYNPSFENNKKNNNINSGHKSPLFECDCFDCYTSFWFKWDSSPNRELIHQAIEAFEETLTNNEHSKVIKKTKKKDKMGHRRLAGKSHSPAPVETSVSVVQVVPFDEISQENVEDPDGVLGNVVEELVESPEMAVVVRPAATAGGQNKGLARKVLPDVIGLFNWRLFSLWSPNV